MTLEEAKKIVFEKKPEFKKLAREYGDMTWLQYAETHFKAETLDFKRQAEFLDIFTSTLLPLLGKTKTKTAVQTLKSNYFVSTADHHSILCHPFFSNASLLRSHPTLQKDKNYAVISLTCGIISTSNSSYARGVFFHDDNLNEVRIPFISLLYRQTSLCGLKAIEKATFEKGLMKVHSLNLSREKKDTFTHFFNSILNCQSIWDQVYASDQMTIINDLLWKILFKDDRGNLVYLEIESLVANLLIQKHLESDTEIHKILFSKETRERYLQNFEGIPGAHKTDSKKGSHLFWYVDKNKRIRKQLFLNENILQSIEEDIKIYLTPQIIEKHLKDRTLIPTMALSYSLVSFYYGVTLGGGFSQIQYLNDIRDAFKKTLGQILTPKTNIFTGEQVLLTIAKDKRILPATLIDLLLHTEHDRNLIVDQEIENKKISDTLSYMMDEFIEIVTGKKEMISDLPPVTPSIYV